MHSVIIGNEIRSFVKNIFGNCHSNKECEINWTYMSEGLVRTRRSRAACKITCSVVKENPASHCVDHWLWLLKDLLLHVRVKVACKKEEAYTQIKSQAIRTFSLSALEEADKRTLLTTRGQASTSLQRSLGCCHSLPVVCPRAVLHTVLNNLLNSLAWITLKQLFAANNSQCMFSDLS